ncbi:hypothetical protein MASR2M66_17020 [Chloroflexota bacterium]
MLKLTRPLNLFLVTLTYLLGAGISTYLGKDIQLVPLILGFAIVIFAQISMSFLREVFRPHNEPLIKGETPQQKETLRNNLLYISIGLIGAVAGITYTLHLNFTLALPTILFLLFLIIFVFLYSIPPFHLANRGFGELTLAVQIAYIVPSIAFLLQSDEIPRLLTALLIPLTSLALAYFLILNFTTFQDDQKYDRGTLLCRLTWERAVPLHHGLLAFAYIAFALALPFGFALNIIAPAFLTLPFAIFQIFQLRAIANGNPPNWKLLTSTALMVFGLTAYFLVFTFWFR